MSVIVKGMEMPNTCEECKTSCEVGSDMHCLVTDDGNKWGWKLSESGFYSRPDWCPLRPLPNRHGRLIDADAMERVMSDTVQGDIRQYPYSDTQWEMAFKWLDHQPTIVEAEGDLE